MRSRSSHRVRSRSIASATTIALTLLSLSSATSMVLAQSDPPVAVPGGPFSVSAAERVEGGWTLTFDGSSSTGSTPIVAWDWDFGTDTFNGDWLNTYKWFANNAYNDDALVVLGSGWGNSYVFTREPVRRVGGSGAGGAGNVNLSPVDFDQDGDVDLSDFQVFLGCFNGPNRPPGSDNCAAADRDSDGDVDLSDFSEFLTGFTGPRAGNPPPPATQDETPAPAVFQARVIAHGARAMVGFKNTNNNYSYSQMPYALFFDNGVLRIYENASHRANVGGYTSGEPYDVRIELKAGAGAIYWFKAADATDWTQLYNSNNGTPTEVLRGVSVDSGKFVIDDLREVFPGKVLSHKLYWGGPVTLTVRDEASQTASAATDVIVADPVPLANAGGPYAQTEAQWSEGGWTFTLDASNSVSGHEIARYAWDFGVDTFDGDIAPSPLDYIFGGAYLTNGTAVVPGGGWGNKYLFTRPLIRRDGTVTVQARVIARSCRAMWGLQNASTNYSYSQMPYAIFFDNGTLRIYEDGSNRGSVGSYTSGEEYDVKIVVKNTNGARYYFKPASAADWTLLYDSYHSNIAAMRLGVTCDSGDFVFLEQTRTLIGRTIDGAVTKPESVTLTITDVLGQSSSHTAPVQIVGTPPIANAGGPYLLSEADLLATGATTLTFDGTGSSDDVEIVRYEWDLGTDTLDGLALDPQLWTTARAESNDRIVVTGSGGWGGAYALSRQAMHRAAGMTFQCRVLPSGNHAMCGFHNGSTNYSYTQFPYAIYLNNGGLEIYEDGSGRGNVGSYSKTTAYEVRIVLKGTAGATYWIREAGTPAWRLLYDSSYGSAIDFVRGITVHSGVFELDDLREVYIGPALTYRVTKELDITLTVTDRQGQTGRQTTRVQVAGSNPYADAGGPYAAPLGAMAVLDGSASGDDVGIARYEWDFGDGSTGLGQYAFHAYAAAGVYTVALTVRDAAGRTDTAYSTVEVLPMAVCAPWDYDRVSGLEIPHNVWDGLTARLKAVVYTDTPADQITYTWDFGDGSAPLDGTVTSTRAIEATHVYAGSPGALFTASLTVHDPVYGDLFDTYPVQIHAKDLTIEINVAIDEALWWLHKQQNTDGTWSSYSSFRAGSTASVLQAMEINGHVPTRSSALDPYVDDVTRGLRALFGYLVSSTISVQPFGDPDSNGNGAGIAVNESYPIYQGGMVMDAIAASGAPDLMADTGPVGVRGLTYRRIVQDMADMYAWGQYDSGDARGGWRYGWNEHPDNSASQWGAIGFLGAKSAFGIDVAGWIKEQNNFWLTYSYNGTGFGYTGSGNDVATTPSGMIQLAFAGFERSDPRWQTSEAWIANNWNWWLTRNNIYAYYAFAKAMRVALPTPIVTLAGTELDWYHDSTRGLPRKLLGWQDAEGKWPQDLNWNLGRVYNTAWSVIILTPTLFTRPPVAVAGSDIVWAFDRELTFDGSASYHTDPVRVLSLYEWDFNGDGTYDYIGQNPVATHTFAFDPGIPYPMTYEARLRVTDDIGQTDTDTRLVTIAEPPHAPFAVIGGPYKASLGVPFHPDASGSYDIDPTDYITRQEWDFDGSNGYNFDTPDAAVDCAAPPGGCGPVSWTFTKQGTYNIALRVWDNAVLHPQNKKLASEPAYTTVTVGENAPPVADAGGPYVIDECQPLQLDGTASSDPNDNALTYAWDLDGDGEFDDSTEPAPTYTWHDHGPHVVSLIVSDGAFQSEPAQAEVTVRDTVPTVVLTGPGTLAIEEEGTYTAAVTSPCDDVQVVEWDWDYNTIAFRPSGDTGTTGKHRYPAQGTYVVAVQVTDEDGSTALDTREVQVAAPNAPRLPAGRRIKVVVGQRHYDAANQVHRGEFTLVSEHDQPITGPIGLAFATINPSSVQLANVDGMVRNPANGQQIPYVSFTDLLTNNKLMPGQSIGPKWVEFSDADGVAFTFEAMAYLFNTAPKFASTPVLTADEGQRYRYSARAVDEDGDVVAFSLRDTQGTPPPDGMTVHPTNGLVDWMPGQSAAGPHPITLVATDGMAGGEAVQTFEIVVGAVNVAPTFTSEPVTTAQEGSAYPYAAVAVDPDGDPVTYALEAGPAGMTVGPDTGVVDWAAPVAGSYTVRLIASDNHGNQAVQEYTLTVVACQNPPRITSDAVTAATEGQAYHYHVQAEIPGGTLVYSLPVAPTGMSIDADTGHIQWTPSYTQAGLRTVKVRATKAGSDDCRGEQVFQIDVANANGAPVVTSTPVTTASEGVEYRYDVVASDPDGDPIAFSLVQAPPGMSIHSIAGIVRWTPSQSAAADSPYTVVIEVADPAGATGRQQFQIEVGADDVAPRITSEPNYVAVESQLYQYAVEAVDPDNDPLTFALTTAPAGMTIDPDSGLIEWTPGQQAAKSNPHAVVLTVSDPAGHTATQAYDLYVRSSNVPPVITSDPVTTGREGDIYAYKVTATDEDGDTLKYKLTVSPSGMSIHPTTGQIEWLVPQMAAASNPTAVTVSVSDGLAAVEQSFEIVVEAVNVAPIIYSTPVTTAAVGAAYQYDVEANDQDGDVVTYSLSVAPDGMTIDPASGLITWQPQAGQDGDQDVTVLATDPAGLSGEQSFVITVAPCADAPQFTSTPKMTASPEVEYRYEVKAKSQGGTVTFSLSQAPDGMTIDEATGVIRWAPTADQMGVHDVVVVATRDGVCPSQQAYQVEVKHCDLTADYYRPVLAPGRLASFIPQVTANCEPLRYALQAAPPGMQINATTGVIQWVPQVGAYHAVAEVRDAWDNVVLVTIEGEVLPETPPHITSVPSFTARVGVEYSYQVVATDDEGDALTYSFDAAPSGMQISADGLVTWTPTAAQIDSHAIAIRVDDGRGGWIVQTYTLTVSLTGDNRPPQITSTPPFTAAVNQPYAYAVEATDPDGDALVFSLTTAPAGAAIDPTTGVLSWTPTGTQIGSHPFVVRVEDGRLGRATQTFSVTVSLYGNNQSPVITSAPPTTAAIAVPYVYGVAATDPDGDAITFALAKAPAGMTINAATGLVQWTPTAGQTGGHAVTIHAIDARGGRGEQTFTVTVSQFGDNRAPRIISSPTLTAQADAAYAYDVNAVDDDGDPVTYALSDSPLGMQIDAGTGAITWTPDATMLGTHAVTVSVSDNHGASVEQAFAITVSLDGTNRAPQIVSAPTEKAIVGVAYQYDVDAIDADGDAITYSLSAMPVGMAIDPGSGLIMWTPTEADVGTHLVTVVATDPEEGWNRQTFELTVAVNTPPQIVSTPVTKAIVGLLYRYEVRGEDVDEYQLTYVLDAAPDAMQINEQTGEITWTPATEQVGEHLVRVIARDSLGAESVQEFTLTVFADAGADFLPPSVTITVEPTVVDPGEPVTIKVKATDDFAVASVVLTVNDVEIELDADGTARYTPAAAGAYVARAVAKDLVGRRGRATGDFYARTPGDTIAPTVAITAPAVDSQLTAPTALAGTVEDENLYRYTLAYRAIDASEFTVFATGYAPVSNGTLGTLDPTQMVNGVYEVRLQAQDTNGNVATIVATYSIAGTTKIGRYRVSFVDLHLPLAGLPISITRTYDSRDKTVGDFGIGWQLDVGSIKTQENRPLGVAWRQTVHGSFIRTYLLEPVNPPIVSVTWPDGHVERFLMDVMPSQQALLPIDFISGVRFTALAGTSSSLRVIGDTSGYYDGGAPGTGNLYFYSSDVLDPDNYVLTTKDGTEYTFAGNQASRTSKLQSIEDASGNRLQITLNGIFHSSNKNVTFERDEAGRITKVTAPTGAETRYEYDERGRLIAVTDAEDNRVTYVYNDEDQLTDIVDPLGRHVSRSYYDEDGRLIAVEDGNGKRIRIDHNTDQRQEVVWDAKGNATVYEYDDAGHVASKIDALGHQFAYTYDQWGNVLTETGPDGSVQTTHYDADGQLLRNVDALGRETKYEYDSLGGVRQITDPKGGALTMSYDGQGNLTGIADASGNSRVITPASNGLPGTVTDATGRSITFEYTAAGQPARLIDGNGHVATYRHDANGNVTEILRSRTVDSSPVEVVVKYEYDKMDRVVAVIDAEGRRSEFEYDEMGRETAIVEAGRRTEFTYDPAGQLLRTRFPDGSEEVNEYDANGNLVTTTDREGRITRHEYDAVNRLARTIYADGAHRSYTYDMNLRIATDTDENGRTTTSFFDAAGQLLKVMDPLGHETTFVYDANGNVITQTDALGRVTQFEYDAANRLVKTIRPGGTTIMTEFDALGRTARLVDAGGRTTQYEFDARSRLTKVTDAMGGVTRYEYDEVGNRIRTIDALGRVTAMRYDNLGRVTRRTLPLGVYEEFTYDAAGNVHTHVDFNGRTTTFTYDDNDRLLSKAFEDGTHVDYTWTPTGNLATATDGQGVTRYQYDARDRLARVERPDGLWIEYSYDAAGNRRSITTPNGTTSFEFDELNRLVRTSDSEAGVTLYEYDAAGRLRSQTNGNGTRTLYDYDVLDRLTNLTHLDPSGNTIEAYEYAYSAADQRLRVTEHTGRTVTYAYDALGRIELESIVDPTLGARAIRFTYDAVGNRRTRSEGMTTITYAYDDNDRLLGDGASTFDYDNNGNLIHTNGASPATYSYDAQDRLTAASIGGHALGYAYDADGRLVRSSVDGIATDYLVDPNRPLAEIIEEHRDGDLAARYVHGRDLLAAVRGGAASYYHHDGQTSTRLLTDGLGGVTDTYAYEAFGAATRVQGSTPNPHRWIGERYDANLGLYYLRARWADPATGRFFGRDPWAGSIQLPMTLHKYAYSMNDPINRIDYSGLESGTIGEKLTVTSILQMVGRALIQQVVRTARGKIIKVIAAGLFFLAADNVGINAWTGMQASNFEDQDYIFKIQQVMYSTYSKNSFWVRGLPALANLGGHFTACYDAAVELKHLIQNELDDKSGKKFNYVIVAWEKAVWSFYHIALMLRSKKTDNYYYADNYYMAVISRASLDPTYYTTAWKTDVKTIPFVSFQRWVPYVPGAIK